MFAVVFEVNPRPDRWDAYLGHAASLRPELLQIEGFIANERYASRGRPGWLVSLSLWRNEKALIRWRTHALHHDIQGKGRSSVFADYHLRVGEVTRDDSGTRWPAQRLDVTETGRAKALTLTEYPPGGSPPPATEGLLESDLFDSITRPGSTLRLQGWADLAIAEAIAPDGAAHHVVRVIRDYSMHSRVEAPQYFAPIAEAHVGVG